MKKANRLCAACVLGVLAMSQQAWAITRGEQSAGLSGAASPNDYAMPVPKAVLTQTLGSRGFVSSSATLYGGFEIRGSVNLILLVRGNSLGTLNITQAYLDAPRTRVYNVNGTDIAFDGNGNPGFNGCTTDNQFALPVRNFYANTRGEPAVDRDSCTSGSLAAGVYTFSVTPSIPGVTTVSTTSSPASGQVLFEITLSP